MKLRRSIIASGIANSRPDPGSVTLWVLLAVLSYSTIQEHEGRPHYDAENARDCYFDYFDFYVGWKDDQHR
jgi:hypothetical protein